jgi:sodium-dependent dicarboxylate transporter 2/3/5
MPCLGVINGSTISKTYFSDSIIVCMGSLIMASAVETYQLHHRAASVLLQWAQYSGISGILFAFVFITGFLSMWLSNTATAALLIPLSSAICSHLAEHPELLSGAEISQAGMAIDLSIAFAASLGGMATLTGTGSNLVLQGTLLSIFGEEGEITFLSWFMIAAPLTVMNLFLLWIILGLCFLWPYKSLYSLWRSMLSAEIGRAHV